MEAALHGPSGRFPLGPDVLSIGSAPGNAIVIADDPKVAPYHTQIHFSGQGYTITDLGSPAGTSVNGHMLNPQVSYPLAQGDTIHIGNRAFTYVQTLTGSHDH